MSVTIQEIRDMDIVFSNQYDPLEENFTIELSMSEATSRPFLLWVNGQLQGVYSTLSTLNRVANRIIEQHNLLRIV